LPGGQEQRSGIERGEVRMSVSLLVVDDHEMVRLGVESLLAGSPVEVVGHASNGNEALTAAREMHPDVVLMDIRMPEGDGLEALERLHNELPEVKVVLLSTYDNPTYMARAQALGASDFLLKGCSRDTLVNTITSVAEGRCPTPFGELRRVAGKMSTKQLDLKQEVPLTQRETQVLRHLALGLSNKEIGQSLTISVETVKEHVQNVLRKIDCTDRTQAAVWAVRRGLV
jgi:DNA-binding NarL/FixJ family response regulator